MAWGLENRNLLNRILMSCMTATCPIHFIMKFIFHYHPSNLKMKILDISYIIYCFHVKSQTPIIHCTPIFLIFEPPPPAVTFHFIFLPLISISFFYHLCKFILYNWIPSPLISHFLLFPPSLFTYLVPEIQICFIVNSRVEIRLKPSIEEDSCISLLF